MKKHIRLFVVLFLFSSTMKAQWQDLPIEEGYSINNLEMVSETVGYGHFIHSMDGRYLAQTKDAGLSWDLINVPDTFNTNTISVIDFYAENKGVVVVTDWSLSSSPTSIIRTLDNGATWEDITPLGFWGGAPVLNTLNDDIIFMAAGSSLFKTLDGGASWTSQEFPFYIESLDFTDEQNGVIGLFDGTFAYMGGMYCTSDGGESWQGTLLERQYSVVSDVQMINEDFVIATPFAPIIIDGVYNHFFVSKDKGLTWDTIAYPGLDEESGLLAIEFQTPDEGFVSILGDDNKIYKTTDGGASWTLEFEPEDYAVGEISYGGDVVYLSGGYEKIYKSNTSTSTQNIIEQSVNIFPNPARSGSIITIDTPLSFDAITLYDNRGAKVLEQEIKYSNTIQIPTLNTGVYIALLRNKLEVSSVRLFIID